MSYQELPANVDPMVDLEIPLQAAELLANRFVNEYGTIICCHIHRQFFGRIFYLRMPEELERFITTGKISEVGEVVGNVTRWVLEILLDKGVVEL